MSGSLIIDILIGLIVLALVVRGYRIGLLRSAFGIAGLVLGATAAYLLIPVVIAWLPWAEWRVPAVLLAALLLLSAGYALGSAIGSLLRRGARKLKLGVLDRLAGALATGVVGLLALGVLASSLSGLGAPVLTQSLAGSAVLRGLDQMTPDPVKHTIAALRGLAIDEAGPWVVEALGLPADPPEAVDVELDTPALNRAAESVARVTGLAFQCGSASSGSGFVVAPDRVVTNAHVVAGLDAPVVELPGRLPAEGRVVYFDPVDDLAIIAADTGDTRPLPLGETLAVGSPAVVQGHPLGGPFRAEAATVADVAPIQVEAIDGSGRSARESYTLLARVQAGNSGGPLLSTDGAVVGVIFARSQLDENVGFAMTVAELMPAAILAPELTAPVASGSCER